MVIFGYWLLAIHWRETNDHDYDNDYNYNYDYNFSPLNSNLITFEP